METGSLSKTIDPPRNSAMVNSNEQNVYFGPDSLKKYFNPDCQPPLPLVELPEYLNPFYQDGVRIYAKMMTMHPANNVKAMPGKMGSDTETHRSLLT
jgi:hypothetical protein